jgi:DNA-binding MarR family transcriptional regulator
MISRYEQFSFVISGIYRYIQKIERDEMEKFGYKGAYAQYLAALYRFPEGLTSVQLSEICDRDKAAVSRVTAEMEEKGLLVRDDTPYRAKLRLTDKGREVSRFVRERGQKAVEAAGCDLSDEDRRIIYALLDSISARLESISRDGLPEE